MRKEASIFTEKNSNLFLFDDLLILCCKEILLNGLKSNNIPTHLQPWLAMKILDYLPEKMTERIAYHITQDTEANRVMSFREDTMNKDSFFVTIKTIPSKHQEGIDDQREYLNIFKNGANPPTHEGPFESQPVQETLPNSEEVFSNQIVKFVAVGEERACGDCRVNKVQARVRRSRNASNTMVRKNSNEEDRGYKTEEVYNSHSDAMESNQDTDESGNNSSKRSKKKKNRKRNRSSESYQSYGNFKRFAKENQIYNCLEDLCAKKYTRAAGLYEHYKLKHESQWEEKRSDIREFCKSVTLTTHQDDIPMNPENLIFDDNSKNEKSFPCPLNDCPSGYARKSRMFKHVSSRHNNFWVKNEDDIREQNHHYNDHGAEKFVMPVTNPNLSKYERWLGGSMQIRLLNMTDQVEFCPDFGSYPGAKGETGRWICKICGKVYDYNLNSDERRDPTDMRMVLHHVKLHTSSNKVPCEFDDCGKSFVDQRNMKDHMRTHPGVGKLRCGICNFEDAKLNKYNSHMKQRHPAEFEREAERKRQEKAYNTQKDMMNQAHQG